MSDGSTKKKKQSVATVCQVCRKGKAPVCDTCKHNYEVVTKKGYSQLMAAGKVVKMDNCLGRFDYTPEGKPIVRLGNKNDSSR